MKKGQTGHYLPRISDAKTIQRFMQFVKPEQNTGCWIWTGCIWRNHGMFWCQGSQWAHRIAFVIFKEAIPNCFDVHHRCGSSACVNPSHLVLVSRTEHINGMVPTEVPF